MMRPQNPMASRSSIEEIKRIAARSWAGKPEYDANGYHLIIYRFRPIFAAGAKKACNGR
jgi:hypothetical protein